MSRILNYKASFVSINPVLGLMLLLASIVVSSETAIANTSNNSTSVINAIKTEPNLNSQGRSAYQAGRYSQAKILWQQAYQQAPKNSLTQAQILNYLALTSHKLGEWEQAREYLSQSFKLLQLNKSDPNSLKIKAQTLNTQGRLELGMGNAQAALESWRQAASIYQQVGDDAGVLGVKINQAQAWQNLGLYRRAQKSLQEIVEKLELQSDPSLKIAGWRNLGIALQVTGNLNSAREVLNRSLALSQKLNLAEESSTTLFSLGNTALAKDEPNEAITFYQQAAATTSQPLLKTEAQLNQLSLLVSTQQWQQAHNLLPTIKTNLTTAVPNRKLIYLHVNLAKNAIALANNAASKEYLPLAQKLLETSVRQARELKDPQAESYAVGMLGYLYEKNRQVSLANKYTQQAVQLAHSINNPDLIYQWQWQLGRLLKTQGDRRGAIASYTEAVNALESLRSDLVVTNADMQFSFRQSIEPVYRELVSLLLSKNGRSVSQENLLQARNTIESLQLAELNNFFREACLDVTPTAIDRIDPQAAVIYPIIQNDRFTQDNLREQIETARYPIIHIATHGQFSSNRDDTFLLAWDENITIEQLDELLQNNVSQGQAIELLILSACETARGDERAALGLAGMAVKAGARTTLATLWAVYDRSTALIMNNFYENITQPQKRRNKAYALRQAQLDLLNSPEFRHPYYWASFIMIGNWL